MQRIPEKANRGWEKESNRPFEHNRESGDGAQAMRLQEKNLFRKRKALEDRGGALGDKVM